MKAKLLGCMTIAVFWFATSCTNDPGLEGAPQHDGTGDDEMEVTFALSARELSALTRSDESKSLGSRQRVGKGEHIDMLIYAVYDENNTLLEQYGQNLPDSIREKSFDKEKTPALQDQAEHKGQAIINVENTFKTGGTYSITLRLMRNKEYHIAFWAQSSQTTAFDTRDLRHVEVKYEGAENNDEFRDAFCKVESFIVTPSSSSRTVILSRPMAQINVGTTGADYKNHKESYGGSFYTASQIVLEGVSRYIDVVKDKILTQEDLELEDGTGPYKDIKGEPAKTTATFALAKIPAYRNYDIPWDDDEAMVGTEDSDEEFLYADVNIDGTIQPYKTSYPTGTITDPKTETFKYLSMCYVLVHAEKESDSDDQYTRVVLPSVNVTFAYSTEDPGAKTCSIKEVINMPVRRNWRTNILGGIYDKDPQDPDVPEDPSSLFNSTYFLVNLNPAYDGEYNNEYPEDENQWTENPFPSDK